MKNPDHKKELHRIKRIQGQLEGVKNMIVNQKYCPDILTQTKAIKSAVASLESVILKKHLECCVYEAFEKNSKKDQEEKIKEILSLFQKQIHT